MEDFNRCLLAAGLHPQSFVSSICRGLTFGHWIGNTTARTVEEMRQQGKKQVYARRQAEICKEHPLLLRKLCLAHAQEPSLQEPHPSGQH